jgi:predicted polyphosphate/ATP-dependent NAD kinase
MTTQFRLGLIVNPLAGLGGSVGLKGSDGMAEQALALGAVPMAQQRARQSLEQLLPLLARGDDMRYRLLAEASGRERGRFVLSELAYLGVQMSRAVERTPESPSRGITLN